LDCINQCAFQAYKKYVLHEKEKPNIYSSLGGRTHDVLEGITNGTNTEGDLLSAIQDELEDMDMLGIEFPLDRNGENSIRENWIKDMEHFARTYVAPKNKKLKAEEMVLYKSPNDVWLQGFLDLQWIHKDGSVSIYDFKTSTLYNGKDIASHARQLILYALAKEQEGVKVRNVAWIFLKYLSVTFQGYKTSKSKQKTEITKHIERRKLYSELEKYFRTDLEEMGMDSLDVELILDKTKQACIIGADLPEELKDKYTIKPCVISVDLTRDAIDECIKYIEDTVKMWESLDSADEKNYSPCKFTKIVSSTGKEVLSCFFCSSLCGFSDNCYHYKDFINTWTEDEDSDDLF